MSPRGERRRLAGLVVAITGGGRGIGEATARALSERGCSVSIGDLDPETARTVAESLPSKAIGCQLDVSDRDSFEGFYRRTEDELGPIDVLVNNAGIMVLGPFADEADEVTDRMLDVNVRGVMTGTKIALSRMAVRRSGHIINIASQAGKTGFPGAVTYSAGKFAVVGICESLRLELRGTGIDVSCVMPAIVDTELGSGLGRPRLVRNVTAGEVAEAIVEAVETGRYEVWIPRFSRSLVAGSAVVPRPVAEAVARFVGVDRVLADADKRDRAAYEERAMEGGSPQQD